MLKFKLLNKQNVDAAVQDLVGKYSQQMVKGMLQLLSNCPSETAHLRKELLIAAKHILTTDLRSRTYRMCNARTHTPHAWMQHLKKFRLGFCATEFIPCMDKLFDEAILIGSGYTARETLRCVVLVFFSLWCLCTVSLCVSFFLFHTFFLFFFRLAHIKCLIIFIKTLSCLSKGGRRKRLKRYGTEHIVEFSYTPTSPEHGLCALSLRLISPAVGFRTLMTLLGC